MRVEGVAESVKAAWASPVVFVSEKDGSMRFYGDYRCLDAVTDRNSYPVLCTNEYIELLGEARMFSTHDASPGYWQVKTNNKEVKKKRISSRIMVYSSKQEFFFDYKCTSKVSSCDECYTSFGEVATRYSSFRRYRIHLKDTGRAPKAHRWNVTVLEERRNDHQIERMLLYHKIMDRPGQIVAPKHLELARKTTEAMEMLQCSTAVSEMRFIRSLQAIPLVRTQFGKTYLATK